MTKTQWICASTLSVFFGLQTVKAEPAILLRVESLDTDGDGAISTAEFESGALERFAKDDLDRDGKVTRVELQTKIAALRQQRFFQSDLNGDDVLDRGELPQMVEPLFTRLDVDESGTLSEAEVEAVSPLSMAPGTGMDPRAALPDDLDRDGAITREEALTAARTLMRHLDANGDGVLRADELALRRQLLGGGPLVLAP